MKNIIYKSNLFLLLFVFSVSTYAQSNAFYSLKVDSLRKDLKSEKEDTNKVNTLILLSNDLIFNNPLDTVNNKEAALLAIITISDNGSRISQKIIDKIFQPFFTTKPTGQETGLGLSLSYDIIKSHGGEIKVETEGGKGSTFILQLPLV